MRIVPTQSFQETPHIHINEPIRESQVLWRSETPTRPSVVCYVSQITSDVHDAPAPAPVLDL
jgi:hypothetical protein